MKTSTLKEKIDSLLSWGMTYKAVAERAKCDTSTVFRIRSGGVTNPSYSVGSAIDALYLEMAKQHREKAA